MESNVKKILKFTIIGMLFLVIVLNINESYAAIQKKLQASDITLPKSYYEYTSKTIQPEPRVRYNTKILTKNIDYTVEYRNNINVGTATIVIKGKGNYTGTVTKRFMIKQRNLKNCIVTLENSTFTYDGLSKKPKITSIKINDAGRIISLNKSNFTVRYIGNTNAGMASVVITSKSNFFGGSNFTGSKIVNFTIEKALITDCSITVSNGYNIGGTVENPEVDIRINNIKLDYENYSLEYKYEENLKRGTVIITGQKNFKDSIEKEFDLQLVAKMEEQQGKGYTQIVKVANKTYKIYNQRSYSRLISRSGCSITSEAIVLSAYGKDLTPTDIANDVAWIFPRTIKQIAGDLEGYGITCSYESLSGNKIQEAQADSVIDNTERIIKNNLLKGMPVIMLVHQGKDNRYTSDAHYIVLVGMDKNGNPAIADPNGVGYRCETDLRTLIKEYMYFNSRAGERGYVLIQEPMRFEGYFELKNVVVY